MALKAGAKHPIREPSKHDVSPTFCHIKRLRLIKFHIPSGRSCGEGRICQLSSSRIETKRASPEKSGQHTVDEEIRLLLSIVLVAE